ncbi:cupin-like domain-containing protein [Oculatella sp. FACHB-28]|uniref:cupin-like domain-containing protein n=1 Tax=Oculatella sp. FACHB-28 TaxID=2692845 RepID=UPI00168A0E6F|nr:cupin-like domain-containing protein [Oculatella sp. FACHB-28]MBD2055605.1 cupin-like domain-containing protein [Oculatella sp. FACHB-28]
MQPELGVTQSGLNYSVHSISRVPASALTASEFFEQYQKPGVPVIVAGLLDAELDWSLDYLREKLNTFVLPIRRYGWKRYEQDKRTWQSIGSGTEAQRVPFIQYAEMLESGEAQEQDIYLVKRSLKNTPLEQNLASLQQVGEKLGLAPMSDFNLWLGTSGHITCLHYDPMDGTLIQLRGAKKVVLFPPSQLYNLYPFSFWVHLRHGLKMRASYSQVYPERPDFEAFPRLRQALQHRYDDVLRQGEVLFIPAGWWHELTTVGNEAGDVMVCSVNRFWQVPAVRSLRLWSKWRVHLGSVCAIPHILGDVIRAIASGNAQALSQIWQKI